MAGAFHQPQGVFVSTHFLQTLPQREFAAGMAEVIKYALLGDAELLRLLEASPLTPGCPQLSGVIRRCCALKAALVEPDEREIALDGGRMLLNLGHTFGHAIEHAAGYGAYLHGEAVAIGLAAAAHLSQRLGEIGRADEERVLRVLAAHGLPIRLRSPLPVSELLEAAARDKKNRLGKPHFVTLSSLGKAVVRSDIHPAWVADCFLAVGGSRR